MEVFDGEKPFPSISAESARQNARSGIKSISIRTAIGMIPAQFPKKCKFIPPTIVQMIRA